MVGQFGWDAREPLRRALLQDDQLHRAFARFRRLSPRVTSERSGGSYSVRGDDPEAAVKALYAVRNNLFHGSKRLDADRDREVVRVASAFLDRTLALFVEAEVARPFPEFEGPVRMAE